METILAVITDWDDALAVLHRAQFIAAKLHTQVELFRPVHARLGELNKYIGFDNFDALRDAIMSAENKLLAELNTDQQTQIHSLWCDRVHSAIVSEAERTSAGLIVMMANHQRLLANLAHTPDDWHLLRDAPCPVWMMTRELGDLNTVVAAVDCLDESEQQQKLSARVIDQARAMATAHQLPLTVVTVVPDPALIYASMVNVPVPVDYLTQLEQQVDGKLRTLLAHLGVTADSVLVKSGRVEDVLVNLASHGLLVIGSRANKGVKGLLLGNSAERILNYMQSDMLVVN